MDKYERLFRIVTPYYSGGVVFDARTKRCIDAAPILAWLIGWEFENFKAYCKRKNLSVEKVPLYPSQDMDSKGERT